MESVDGAEAGRAGAEGSARLAGFCVSSGIRLVNLTYAATKPGSRYCSSTMTRELRSFASIVSAGVEGHAVAMDRCTVRSVNLAWAIYPPRGSNGAEKSVTIEALIWPAASLDRKSTRLNPSH